MSDGSEAAAVDRGASAGLNQGPSTGLRTGNAGKGRPKGSLNKVTLAAREAILLAGEGLGGVDGLIAWAKDSKDNLRIFWSVIYPKVLPYGGGPGAAAVQVTGALVWRRPDEDGPVEPPEATEAGRAAAEAAVEAARAAAAEAAGHGGPAGPATAIASVAAALGGSEAARLEADAKAAGAEADSRPVFAATVVWKAPDEGSGILPGLPGGPAARDGAEGPPPPPMPPPKG